MIRLLLDTHALIWALMEPERLGARARELLADPSVPRWVSAATGYEIGLLSRAGKVRGLEGLALGFSGHVAELGALELPLTSHHMLLAASFAHQHGDPFDRMLTAQALLEGMTLVSRDRRIPDFGVSVVW